MQILNYNPPTHKTFVKVFFTDFVAIFHYLKHSLSRTKSLVPCEFEIPDVDCSYVYLQNDMNFQKTNALIAKYLPYYPA